jgi:hypothetical protein
MTHGTWPFPESRRDIMGSFRPVVMERARRAKQWARMTFGWEAWQAFERGPRLHGWFQQRLAFAYTFLRFRYPLLGLLVAGLVALFGATFAWQRLNDYVNPRSSEQHADLVRTAAQLLGGAVLLIGLYWTAKNVQVNREGQITERFTRAIEQLGETDDTGRPKLEIRLGGIYALERIARDSDKDYGPIMEVLTAYLRENAQRPPERPEALPMTQQDIDDEMAEELYASRVPGDPRPRADIQAALTVLGRRSRRRHFVEPERLDLRGVDLRHANLERLHFEHATFQFADFRNANLDYIDLEDSDFRMAQMEGVRLRSTHLKGAWFAWTHLEHASFPDVTLRDIHFSNCYLTGANFQNAHLQRISFMGSTLDGADFRKAHLEEAIFINVDVGRARFDGAHLERVAEELLACEGSA